MQRISPDTSAIFPYEKTGRTLLIELLDFLDPNVEKRRRVPDCVGRHLELERIPSRFQSFN